MSPAVFVLAAVINVRTVASGLRSLNRRKLSAASGGRVAEEAVSHATLAEIEAFKRRMGWRIPWVSSFGSDFNYDYQVSFTKEEIATGKAYYNYKMQVVEVEEASGLSVFYKNMAGDVFQTYSTYGRGAEELVSAYVCLDLTPKGRNETGPGFNLGDWVRHHDRYDADDFDFTEPYQPASSD
jgi:predicted dithiol-disulfide oxidoreductase (DUF899 family)